MIACALSELALDRSNQVIALAVHLVLGLEQGAALVIAGLVAEGRTEIGAVYHIDRGYDRIVDKLRGLGAEVSRNEVE